MEYEKNPDKRGLHLYASDLEWKIIMDALDDFSLTELGKIRSGDALRLVLLEWAKNFKKK